MRTECVSRVVKIDMSKNEQKKPWFIAINPNGRMYVSHSDLRNH
jgi:hypothetical protein